MAKHMIRCWVNHTDCTGSPWDESSRRQGQAGLRGWAGRKTMIAGGMTL